MTGAACLIQSTAEEASAAEAAQIHQPAQQHTGAGGGAHAEALIIPGLVPVSRTAIFNVV